MIEADFIHQGQRVFEIAFRLPDESCDDVGGDGHIGDGGTQFSNDLEIALPGVLTAHFLQHRIGTGLQRKMDMIAHLAAFRHGADGFGIEMPGMWGHETNAFQPLDRVDLANQTGEIIRVGAVGVHRLPQ